MRTICLECGKTGTKKGNGMASHGYCSADCYRKALKKNFPNDTPEQIEKDVRACFKGE